MISVHWTGLLKSYIILDVVAGMHEHEHEHERQTANSLKCAAIKNSIKLLYILVCMRDHVHIEFFDSKCDEIREKKNESIDHRRVGVV